MRILIVEDDSDIARMLRRGLEEARYTVVHEEDGVCGLDTALASSFGLIILDVMLPRMNGMKICEGLRQAGIQTPILMLTARDTVDDKVTGLKLGADDYLPKPFDYREFMARVQALIRRGKTVRSPLIQVADLEIDSDSFSVRRAGQEIKVSRREFDLLEALARSPGRILTREMVRDQIWNSDESFSNTVDVTIGSLRRKIDAGFEHKLIHTVHGVGYVLRTPDGPF